VCERNFSKSKRGVNIFLNKNLGPLVSKGSLIETFGDFAQPAFSTRHFNACIDGFFIFKINAFLPLRSLSAWELPPAGWILLSKALLDGYSSPEGELE
jgi:hypothetical protein